MSIFTPAKMSRSIDTLGPRVCSLDSFTKQKNMSPQRKIAKSNAEDTQGKSKRLQDCRVKKPPTVTA